MSSTCIETKVRNMSGKTAFFGFLYPHGKRLTAGEEYTFFGSIESHLSKVTSKRKRDAFKASLDSGNLVVVSSPVPFIYDATLDVTKSIGIDNGAVTIIDPCGLAYSSSI
jgi:hypothetical protein